MHFNQTRTQKIVFAPIIFAAKWLGTHFPEVLVKMRYYARFHKRLNLDNPQTLNEKILYLSLRTDTAQWTRLADKHGVRSFVKERGQEHTLVKLYAHWKRLEEVDFSRLPSSFVIKSVQGSGDVILVKDKSQMDENAVTNSIKTMLSERFGALEGGKHYIRIEPAVIVEEMLALSEGESLIDYKIWCFNGKPYKILTCSNRRNGIVNLGSYDLQWNYCHDDLVFSAEHQEEPKPLPRPDNYEEMLGMASQLAKGFPCVRVDFYNLHGRIYFGEMTFTSLGGLMDYYSEEFQQVAGRAIDLNYNLD